MPRPTRMATLEASEALEAPTTLKGMVEPGVAVWPVIPQGMSPPPRATVCAVRDRTWVTATRARLNIEERAATGVEGVSRVFFSGEGG